MARQQRQQRQIGAGERKERKHAHQCGAQVGIVRQVAVSLPLFLFTLPSGALADVIDSRRLLIAVEVAILAVSVVFAGLVSLKLATPSLLLATTFLLGVGGALTSPAWGATIP